MSELEKQINKDNIPEHVAIIMDGNGRWAKKKGNNRIFGHRKGVEAVREVVEESARLNIKYLTLYTFSKENWNRPSAEISALMQLLVETINKEINRLKKNKVRLNTIGDTDALPNGVKNKLNNAILDTRENDGMQLNLALNYSAKWEIMHAMKKIGQLIQSGEMSPEDIEEETICNNLVTSDIPDPSLLIRTSGECRISNFLLWQIAYTELYFTDVLWPDFTKNELHKAIIDYQKRERRFGKISEQVSV